MHISKIRRFFNLKSSFEDYIGRLEDFQICICVPLRVEVQLVFPERLRFRLVGLLSILTGKKHCRLQKLRT